MSDMHPPANRRCQIYLTAGATYATDDLRRCVNEGTHWEKWGGCNCGSSATAFCEGDFYTWECDGTHIAENTATAEAEAA